MDSSPQERVWGGCCIVWGDACCLAERGSKAPGSKYLPRMLIRAIGDDPDDLDGNGDVGDRNVLHYHRSPCPAHSGNNLPPYTTEQTNPEQFAHGACSDNAFGFTQSRNGCCPPSTTHESWWEEQGVARWHLTGSIGLVDQFYEWHFEHSPGTNSGHLFVCWNFDPNTMWRGFRKSGFFARQTIYSFVVKNAPSVGLEISGLTFFGSFFRVENTDNLDILENNFWYPTTSKSMLKRPNGDRVNDFPDSITFINCNDAVFSKNSITFAEGKAIEWRGDNVLWRDNTFAYNGLNLFDGDYTVRLLHSSGVAASHTPPSNTSRVHDFGYNNFKFNNQATAVWVGNSHNNIHHNIIKWQNVGGFSHFAEMLGGDFGAQNGKFNHNWVEWAGFLQRVV